MSDFPILTPKMSRARNRATGKVVFNLGLDESSGDVFTESVSGATFTVPTPADYTTEPHAPLVGYSDNLDNHTGDLAPIAAGKTMLLFYGAKIILGGVFGGFTLGHSTIRDKIVVSNSAYTMKHAGTNFTVARESLIGGDVAFFAIMLNLKTGYFAVYDAKNFELPTKAGEQQAARGGENPLQMEGQVSVGNISVPQSVYGALIYELDYQPTHDTLIAQLNTFQKQWSMGHKVLPPGI